jgi:hypothetical protein
MHLPSCILNVNIFEQTNNAMPTLPIAQIAPVKPNNPLTFTREEWEQLTRDRLAEDWKRRYPKGYCHGYGDYLGWRDRRPTLNFGEKATPKL